MRQLGTIFEEMPKLPNVLLILALSSINVFGQATVRWASCEPVRTDPVFAKGSRDWDEYLNQAFCSNTSSINCAPAGTYYVEVVFLIGKNGEIEEVRPRSKIGYGMEEELMRIIWLSPPWMPATQNGRVVRSYRCQTFILDLSCANDAGLF